MNLRYGIFLRPDPATCWAVTQVTTALRQQFGLVSAGAYPPHVTLIGNLATDAGIDELVARLDPVFTDVAPITVFNSGAHLHGRGYEYNVDLDRHATRPNQALGTVAAATVAAVLPLSLVVDDYLTTPVEDYVFAGHLGLASHDLKVDGRLVDEVGDFIDGLPVVPPPSFVARWYSLFEFRADDWQGPWWQTLTWRNIRSWAVATPAGGVTP